MEDPRCRLRRGRRTDPQHEGQAQADRREVRLRDRSPLHSSEDCLTLRYRQEARVTVGHRQEGGISMTKKAASSSATTRKIRIERNYYASANEVWDLWTTREGIESWWAPD